MLLTVLKKIFFKVIINSVYGKAINSVRKRIKVRLSIILKTKKNV